MKIYLVGGAVRDELLNLPVKERDYVVVGASIDEMLAKGFRQVGKDFPVFLHPNTKEEYALARMERKTGRGYTGFTFDTSKEVTLEDDLKRRDITINAIAKTAEGELIDPYHGKEDLEKKLIRHVSEAFIEDPVRILRVARFAARFTELGFTVAPDTMELMQQMVEIGEVDALVAERVWKEFERALSEKQPEKFFEVLESCGALTILFPSLQPEGIKTLIRASTLSLNTRVRFAALFHDNTVEQIKLLCDRYRVPSEYRELAQLVASYHVSYQNTFRLSADELLALLQSVDAFRRPERFDNFLLACEACSFTSYSDFLMVCYQAAKKVDAKEWLDKNIPGKEIAERIAEKRKQAIQNLFKLP
jgi:tRNA nucleotidyltransferase (CCA-adding enzyme)